MQQPIRKATFIVRLWTNGDPLDDNAWRGTAEFIGSGQPRQFQTLDEFIDWLRQELAKTEEKPES
ncbi:MAG: hypothetical protein PVG14_12695 [Anaerolineales bacterium]|jgi:hypothetical protein